MNKRYLFLYFLTFLSCTKPTSTYDRITEFFETEHDREIQSFDHLVIINEMGGCMTCSTQFAELMETYLEEESVLFLVCSAGNKIDISAYLDHKGDNVILDPRNKFASLELIDHGSIIHLGNEEVDTIIEIDARNLDENMLLFEEVVKG